ncbi:MAG: NTP transferase domain-containing protein, partial [Rickettsiales bacterium]|nr:NTP transferase domain-containing protein [Rickettsiales bacterium]
MKTIIVIPSRYGSTRLPAKPLKDIAGTTLVQRVYNIACAVNNVDAVYVATDDTRIAEHVSQFGGNAVMTPTVCINGTERACALAQQLDESPNIIINLQGDAVLTPPWIVQALVDTMQNDPSISIATPAVQLTKEKYEALLKSKENGEVGGTTVTFDKNHNAMYFSKRIIPLLREDYDVPPVYRH